VRSDPLAHEQAVSIAEICQSFLNVVGHSVVAHRDLNHSFLACLKGKLTGFGADLFDYQSPPAHLLRRLSPSSGTQVGEVILISIKVPFEGIGINSHENCAQPLSY
jgi:hypothetical protein